MSALALTPPEPLEDYDPLRSKAYRNTGLGSPLVAYLASKTNSGRADKTVSDKELYVGAFALMFPSKTLKTIDVFDCEHWLALQGTALETKRVRRSHLNDFFKWAIRMDLLDKNPLDKIEQPRRRKNKVFDVFSDAEVAALTGLPALDGTLMLMLFDTGIRFSDAAKLTPLHIVPEPPPGVLAIYGGKGDKDRLVPLTGRLARASAHYQLVEGMDHTHRFWYTRPQGRAISRKRDIGYASFHLWWGRCLEEAVVRYRKPHMSRHTFATSWLRRGGRLETLSLILGHSSIQITFDLYAHLDTRDIIRDLLLIEATHDA